MNIEKTIKKIEFYNLFKNYLGKFSALDLLDFISSGKLAIYYKTDGEELLINSGDTQEVFKAEIELDNKKELLKSIRLYNSGNLDEDTDFSMILSHKRFYYRQMYTYVEDINNLIADILEPARKFISGNSDDFGEVLVLNRQTNEWVKEFYKNDLVRFIIKELVLLYNESTSQTVSLDDLIIKYNHVSKTDYAGSSKISDLMSGKVLFDDYIDTKLRFIKLNPEKLMKK